MSESYRERLESPTSILTFDQCPRRYYYRYVKGLESKPSIHLVLGRIVHSVIQDFHNTETNGIPSEILFESLTSKTIAYLKNKWDESRGEFEKIGLTPEEMESFYEEARLMVSNFCQHHISRVIAYKNHYNLSAEEAFQKLRPKTETKIISERFGIMGVIDAIQDLDGETVIVDYKTSKKNEIDQDCMIQIAIYTLLYKEFFGSVPDKVGIHFLRYGEKLIPSTHELLSLGEKKCQEIRKLNRGEDEKGYPRKKSGLCKYRTGQCDYYDICIGIRNK